ncbi:MAG TPA: hypothetical protein VF384_12935 [Planctomycetota bacterium]
MDSNAADEGPALATTDTGAHLWPALRLWLCYEVLWGAWWLLMSIPEGPGSYLTVGGHLVVAASSYVLIGQYDWL